MLSYGETMDLGADRYRDVLDALVVAGVPAEFTQTGAMCATIEATLEGGRVLLITDAEDSLSWERSADRGWGVGLYRPDGEGSYLDDGPMVYDSTQDGSVVALLPLVASVVTASRGSAR